jgi:hypothetical protein
VQLTFESRVSAPTRERITKMLSRVVYPLGLGDWTFKLKVKRYPSNTIEAQISVEPASHEAWLYLSRALIGNDLALHRVLIHELTHVLTWGANVALSDTLAHVPGDQRRACKATADRLYEQANDAVAIVLTKLLVV